MKMVAAFAVIGGALTAYIVLVHYEARKDYTQPGCEKHWSAPRP